MPPLSPNAPRTASHFLPLALWLAVQLLALTAAAMQVPLADRFPRPPERLALDELVVAQVALAALLFPILMRDRTASLLTIAATWPMLQLAGALASAPTISVIIAAAYVNLWLIVLGIWRWMLQSENRLLAGVAAANALSLGGVALWYLHCEYGSDSVAIAHGTWGPIVATLAAIHNQALDIQTLGPMGLLLAGSTAAATVVWVGRRNAHRSST